MMWSRTELCRSCLQAFLVKAGGAGPFQESAAIACPHCGSLWGSAKTRGVIVTQPLSLTEEALSRLTGRPEWLCTNARTCLYPAVLNDADPLTDPMRR